MAAKNGENLKMETIILIYLALSVLSFFPIKEYLVMVAKIYPETYNIKYAKQLAVMWALGFPVVWTFLLFIYLITKFRNRS